MWPFSRRVYQSVLTPARTAPSSRRSPGTRRRPPPGSSPACSGVIRARRLARKSRMSERLSTRSTLRRPADGGGSSLYPPQTRPPARASGAVSWSGQLNPLRRSSTVRGVVLHTAGDVRVEERPDPKIKQPTDAIIRLTATCICGSDLWPYRGVEPADHQVMGHEYVGIVEEVGDDVQTLEVGDFVVGSFVISDNTCGICQAGFQSKCVHAEFVAQTIGTQAEKARIPHADGTLVTTPGQPDPELIPSLLAASDVLGTGWFAAVAAQAGPGKTVVVVGDGAVGLMAILAASQLGAERIIAMSRHRQRQELARFYGPTDIVEERGDEGVAKVNELTNGLGAHSIIEAVGTQESMLQAIQSTRPGGHVGYVGVTHDVTLQGEDLFMSHVHLHGGPAPVRRFLPDLLDRIWNRTINPGKVFDLELPLNDAADESRAMDPRQATKVLLRP